MHWQLPISAPIATANAVVSLPSDKHFVQFMHAAFGSPALSTFLKALRKNYLNTVPRLTSALVCAHPPHTLATALGHLDQCRSGLDSTSLRKHSITTPAQADDVDDGDENNTTDDNTTFIDDKNLLFCKLHSTADIDAAGRFPIQSLSKNEYQLLSYLNGYIHVEPMPSRHHTAYIAAYDRTFTFWSQFGPLPTVIRLDNETSHQLHAYISTRVQPPQYFPPGNHRANRAERAMRTWKNHFIATLSTASPKFPLNHWDKLLPLAELTLNCLVPWQLNPSISAYHGLTGKIFDFRAHPIAPAGTAILIHDKASARPSWAGHGTPGFYIGPALDHYRCHHVHSNSTSAPRVTDTIAWFPETPVTPPVTPPYELLLAAVLDLTSAVKKYGASGIVLPPTLLQDLIDLTDLYHQIDTISDAKQGEEQRVIVDLLAAPTATTSSRSLSELVHTVAPAAAAVVTSPDESIVKTYPSPPGLCLSPADADQPNSVLPFSTTRTEPLPPAPHQYRTRSSTEWTRNIDHLSRTNSRSPIYEPTILY